MVGRGFECREEVQELRLFRLAKTLQFHDFAEVGIGLVRDVDQIGLHKGFGWGGANLECFEERVDACHGLVHAFHEARVVVSRDLVLGGKSLPGWWSGPSFFVDDGKLCEALLQYVRV